MRPAKLLEFADVGASLFSPGRSHRFRDQQQNTAASTALPRSAVANLVLCFLSTKMTKISYTGEAARRGHSGKGMCVLCQFASSHSW
jgi:hypothetical protein